MASTNRLTAHLVQSATGAANDNLFRQIVGVTLTSVAATWHIGDPVAGERAGQELVLYAGLAFLLPFAVLAPLAGDLGDRLPRHRIVRWTRVSEIALVALGVTAFALNSVPLLFATLIGLATQSALFAPVKLSLLPDLVPPERLARANASVQAVTVVAILGGTFLAGLAASDAAWMPLAPTLRIAVVAGILAIIGCVAAWRIPVLAPANPSKPIRPWAMLAPLRSLSATPGLWAPALSLGGFWGLGAAAQLLVLATGEQTYALGQERNPLLGLCLAGGIIAGALLAPRLTSKAFPAGLPLMGALVAAFALITAGLGASHGLDVRYFAALLAVTGLGAGLWEIPLQVLLQQRAPANARSQVMSASGQVGTLAMLGAIGLCLALTRLGGFTAPEVLHVLGLVTLGAAIVFLVVYRNQFAAWLLTRLIRTLYRVRVVGAEHLPERGGCLVVCNHVSFADGMILAACLPRPARYLVYRRYVQMPVIGWILRIAGVIPIDAEDSRRALLASIDAAVAAAAAGEVVAIFPEGKLTRGGQMDAFRAGMERIAKKANVPIVPAHLDGLWGSYLSRSERRRWPLPWLAVRMRIGAALPPETPAAVARHHVTELGNREAQLRSNNDDRTLGAALLRRAKEHPRNISVQDAGGTITCLQLAAIARVLWRRLGCADDETRVGVLLPPGRGGALINAALALAGRTAVNLNHTVGPAQLAELCRLAGLRTVVSAGAYLKRIGEPSFTQRVVKIEDLLPTIGKPTIMASMLAVLAWPARWLAAGTADAPAAIIFSSGSTGLPKGVELTHRQILANCDAVAWALHLESGRDVVLSPLPLFHSFGLLPGFWLGVVHGLRVAAQPDPTDGKALGALAVASGATFLLSTPTFVRGYLRRVEPEQFKTLRFAVVGAERCDSALKQQFSERYGAALLEGYGCTELAPVAAVNLPEVKRDGVHEIRARDGSVGRALPGIHIFTVDPASNATLPPGSEGLLVVRSAARMRGYLDRDDLSEKAFIHDGYNTGDIGKVDADGFIYITGRLARFAKIGGEMVPLDNVEAALATIAGETCEVAVAAIPDPTRGERLLVLHTGFAGDLSSWLALDQLPALWRPRTGDCHVVDAIPKLGTGKRDLAGIKQLAATIANKPKTGKAG